MSRTSIHTIFNIRYLIIIYTFIYSGILLYTVGTTKQWNSFIYSVSHKTVEFFYIPWEPPHRGILLLRWEPQHRGILLYTMRTTKQWNSYIYSGNQKTVEFVFLFLYKNLHRLYWGQALQHFKVYSILNIYATFFNSLELWEIQSLSKNVYFKKIVVTNVWFQLSDIFSDIGSNNTYQHPLLHTSYC